MKYILFYFIASSHQFILLQPSVQLQHFHARLAGGRDLQLSITLWPVVTPRPWTLRTDRFMWRILCFYKIKIWKENSNGW